MTNGPKKDEYIGLRLPRELAEELYGLAFLLGRPVSSLVRESIEKSLPEFRRQAAVFAKTLVEALRRFEKSEPDEHEILKFQLLYRGFDREAAKIALKAERFARSFAKSPYSYTNLLELGLAYYGHYGPEPQQAIRRILEKIEEDTENAAIHAALVRHLLRGE